MRQRAGGDLKLAMADNEDATTPAAPEEQAQQEGGATRQHNSDSWVIVDEPDKPAEKYVLSNELDRASTCSCFCFL